MELFDKPELLEIELFFTIYLCTYANLNCLKSNCCIKMDLASHNQQILICHTPHKKQTNKQLFLYSSVFEDVDLENKSPFLEPISIFGRLTLCFSSGVNLDC